MQRSGAIVQGISNIYEFGGIGQESSGSGDISCDQSLYEKIVFFLSVY